MALNGWMLELMESVGAEGFRIAASPHTISSISYQQIGGCALSTQVLLPSAALEWMELVMNVGGQERVGGIEWGCGWPFPRGGVRDAAVED